MRIVIERRFAEYGITLYPRLELSSSEAVCERTTKFRAACQGARASPWASDKA